MESYRVLLVEDRDDEAATLTAHLARLAVERGVALPVTRLHSAVEFVAERHPADLILMDIDLPGINGMEAAEDLRAHGDGTPLVFVTSLAQYAVRGYQVDAVDFMVKPVAYGDFALRMGRALRVVERNARRTLAVSTSTGVRVLDLRDLAYVELVRHDLVYHLADGSEVRSRGSIRALLETLPEESFVQLSQGTVANMAHVAVVLPDAVELDDGTRLYFSRSKKRDGLARLSRYLGTGA